MFIVVDQSGAGDATTIAGGLALGAGAYPLVVEVRPGVYHETVSVGPPAASVEEIAAARAAGARRAVPDAAQDAIIDWILRSTDGPAVTRVDGFAPTGVTNALIAGFTIGAPVIHRTTSHTLGRWEDCVFEGGYQSRFYGGPPNLARCEFGAPSRLDSYAGFGVSFDDLHFRGPGMQLWTRNEGDYGPLVFKRCTFEGPADTGVVAHPAGENYIQFEDCSFTNLEYGIVAEAGCDDAIHVSRGRFTDIAQAAIIMERTGVYPAYCPTLALSVGASRFERCGQAVRWWPLLPAPGAASASRPANADAVNVFGQYVGMSADTILDCTGTAIEVRVARDGAGFFGLQVERSAGSGLALTNVTGGTYFGNVRVSGSRFADNGGDGVSLVELVSGTPRQASVQIVDNVFARNAGHGLTVAAQDVLVGGNLSYANTGDGMRLQTPAALQTSDVGLNTFAFNHGAGLTHVAEPGSDPESTLVHHNIAAQNDGEGIHADGPIRENDAWMNAAGDFTGALIEVNLSADPAFCDPYMESFSLLQGSICAPGGPFGQIGAFGIGCAPTATLVSLQTAEVVDGVVRLRWFASGDPIVAARLERRGEAAGWQPIATIAPDGAGMLAFEEPVPAPGRFGYRLAFGEAYTPEAWVEVPGAAFALHVPNPAHGRRIEVRFELPRTAPATIELIDVSGRRVEAVSVPGRTGAQRVALGAGTAVRPGVYLVRVTQSGESRVGRVVVVR